MPTSSCGKWRGLRLLACNYREIQVAANNEGCYHGNRTNSSWKFWWVLIYISIELCQRDPVIWKCLNYDLCCCLSLQKVLLMFQFMCTTFYWKISLSDLYFDWTMIGLFMSARIAYSRNLFLSRLIKVPWWMDSLSSWIWLSIMKCVLLLIPCCSLQLQHKYWHLLVKKIVLKRKKNSSYSLNIWGIPTLFTIRIHIYVYYLRIYYLANKYCGLSDTWE
jgi:hypothetical protein